MYKFKNSIFIRKDINEVFNFYTDFKRFCTVWNDILSINKITEGPLTKGSKYENIIIHNGKDFKFNSEIIDIIENHRFIFSTIKYGVKVVYNYEFEVLTKGTLISFRGDVMFNDYPEDLSKDIFDVIVEEDENHLKLIKAYLESNEEIAI
ncbi:hypothetical protein J2Z44_002378 [Clostridium punense]|uniref:Polyketide cyclase n=1 Tax=Clostridium punense TaxID=1054297 RepID=A0ABS4K430_9CLOT|nr:MULTISPECIES: hypothetical protein [Clostridium]EQB88230.1 hypothetical protein M918_05195 [Clostridium sp. BL8]MBP2022557.1 hypothetical protein [Clostridium punense]